MSSLGAPATTVKHAIRLLGGQVRYQECDLASLEQLDAETAAREEELSIRNFRDELQP